MIDELKVEIYQLKNEIEKIKMESDISKDQELRSMKKQIEDLKNINMSLIEENLNLQNLLKEKIEEYNREKLSLNDLYIPRNEATIYFDEIKMDLKGMYIDHKNQILEQQTKFKRDVTRTFLEAKNSFITKLDIEGLVSDKELSQLHKFFLDRYTNIMYKFDTITNLLNNKMDAEKTKELIDIIKNVLITDLQLHDVVYRTEFNEATKNFVERIELNIEVDTLGDKVNKISNKIKDIIDPPKNEVINVDGVNTYSKMSIDDKLSKLVSTEELLDILSNIYNRDQVDELIEDKIDSNSVISYIDSNNKKIEKITSDLEQSKKDSGAHMTYITTLIKDNVILDNKLKDLYTELDEFKNRLEYYVYSDTRDSNDVLNKINDVKKYLEERMLMIEANSHKYVVRTKEGGDIDGHFE